MKRIAIALVLVVTIAAGLLVTARLAAPQLGRWAYTRQVEARLGLDRRDGLPDGLHVAFCGTGSPLPDPGRAQSCTAIIAAEHVFIVDSGAGSTRNLVLMGIPAGAIDAVLVTHYHSDHISDLGALALQAWVGGARETPLEAWGPAGIGTVVEGMNTAYRLDRGYRTAHHGEAIAPPAGGGLTARPFDLPADGGAVTLFDAEGLTVRAVAVNHDPASPAVAYRFDYGGRSIIVSGDLDAARSPGFDRLAGGADLIVAEALQPELVGVLTRTAQARGEDALATITHDILDYHTTPQAAAEAAQRAGAEALVLTHIVPALPSPRLNAAFLGDAGTYFSGEIRLARDGDAISLPAGSDRIEHAAWLP